MANRPSLEQLLAVVRQAGKVPLTGYEFLLIHQILEDEGRTLADIGTSEEELEMLNQQHIEMLDEEELMRYCQILSSSHRSILLQDPAFWFLWVHVPECSAAR